ncbi:MAG: hypothetical protein Tsb009_25750 [Planctomycetaceae bacterium]
MPIPLTCPECGKTSKVPIEYAGSRVRCPSCETVVTVPEVEQPADDSAQLENIGTTKPQKKKPVSRYRQREEKTTTDVAPDCVIHTFECDDDDTYGRELSEAIGDLLKKDGTFGSVLVTENEDISGKRATIEEGIVSIVAIPGGLMKQAQCTVGASAHILNDTGESVPASFTAQQATGNLKAMKKVNTKLVSTHIARETLRHGTGLRRLRMEISNLATASMIFGILSLIPFASFIMAFLWLIPAIVALVFNRGREEKIGLIRIGIGLAFVILGFILTFYIIGSTGPRRR